MCGIGRRTLVCIAAATLLVQPVRANASAGLRVAHLAEHPIALVASARDGRLFAIDRPSGGPDASTSVDVLDVHSNRSLGDFTTGPLPLSANGDLQGSQAAAVADAEGLLFVLTSADPDPESGVVRPGTVRVFDIATLYQTQRVRVGAYPQAVAVDERTRRLFVASLAAPFQPPSSLVRGTGVLTTLDAITGTVLHAVPIGARPVAIAVDEAAGRAFVASRSGSVSTIDAGNGSVLHTLAVPDACALTADTSAGLLLVDSAGDGTMGASGRAIAVYGASGVPLHTQPVAETACSNAEFAVDGSGSVYVATATGIAVFDASAGTLTRFLPVPARILAFDRDRRLLYAVDRASGSGAIRVVDPVSGGVLRSIAIGADPVAALLDSATGRLFVADGRSSTVSVLAPGG